MKKLVQFFLFYLFFYSSLNAQPASLSFTHYSAKNGLSQSYIYCLAKDKEGYIWIGTQDGLNRFDGYTFESYYANKNISHSLSNNYIWDLKIGQDGHVWIGTNGGGLNCYNPSTTKFSSFYPADSTAGIGQLAVRQIFECNNSNWLVGTEAGLFYFDTKELSFLKISPKNDSFSKTIYSFHRIDDNHILIGSLATFLLFNEQTYQLQVLKLPYPIEGSIHSICSGQNDQYWAGTGKGLLHLNLNINKGSILISQHHKAVPSNSDSLSSSYISSLLMAPDGILWIATNNGLHSLDSRSRNTSFYHYQHDSQNEYSLSNNLVYHLLEIEPGWVWAATQDGINQFNYKPTIFNNFDFSLIGNGLCGNSIHGFLEDGAGHLLASSDKGLIEIPEWGSKLINPEHICYNNNNVKPISDDFIVNITKGIGDRFWLAYRRGGFGLVERNEESLNWKSFQLPAEAYSNIGTNDFLETNDTTLWIASSGLGLWKFNKKDKTYTSFSKNEADPKALSGNYIFSLYEDHTGALWISTADGGLCKMNSETATFQSYTHQETDSESISSNMVLSVFEDSQKRLWACTAYGLNLLREDNTFQRFFQKDGLPNDLIYGMLEGQEGDLWLSTNKGVSKISLEGDQLVSQNFTVKDGLIANEFNQHSFYKAKDQSLCFGSAKGITCFDPTKTSPYLTPPNIIFTSFKLFNKTVKPGNNKKGSSILLPRAINSMKKIVLPYNKNFIAFEFAGINAEQVEENQYAYQMLGLDKDWVYCGNRRFANYPNLKPGKYTFQVKAANHDDIWTSSPRSMSVYIKSPPWKTWWALLIYIALAALFVYIFIKHREYHFRKIEQAKEAERALFRQRSARDFHDEAGNQITKISLMAGIAKRQTTDNPMLFQLLAQMENSVQELRSGMRDFIWVLDPEKDTLFELLSRIKNFANELFEYSDGHFTTSDIDDSLKRIKVSSVQRRHILLIFKEAINNALKYANAQNIHLSITATGDVFQFNLIDDGIGFDIEQITSGNGLKNIAVRANKINAIQEIFSEINKGTTISLKIKITQMGH